ncbi:MAG: adenosylmethionine decarboxylase [Bdellovibrionales bacterium]|nr:S-adenosylmethionine decarboxylase proenzyme [Bdellovibrionales bacterium]NQZ17741.1 adenosylmethionine decarboxylase [Bdellovibrionales bacterium]
MFFEGSEKKIEVVFNPSVGRLRDQPRAFWDKLVEASQAKILSHVSNEDMEAYLLSESSLFVYDHYLVMITCGTTSLINAVEELMKTYNPEQIDAFFYERKNEILPQAQSSHFFEDVKRIQKWFPGEALRFGQEDEHHLFLFSSTKSYKPESDDRTMEGLMHGIDPEIIKTFSECKDCDSEQLRSDSGIASIVKGQVDDFVFDPVGYSLNSIDGNNYFTIHVTPENFGSYVSYETNAFSKEEQAAWAQKVLDVFKPRSFALMLFNDSEAKTPDFPGYIMKRSFQDKISAGYCTQYYSFYAPIDGPQKPLRFEELP